MPYSDDPNKISETHFAAIGLVAATWSHLEWAIDRLIWELADVRQQTGACVTAQLGGIHPRMRALTSLVRLRGGSDPLIDALNKFTSDSEPLVKLRNRIVHDPWLSDTDTGVPVRMLITADKRLQYDFLPMPTEEVQATQKKLMAHFDRFEHLSDDIRGEMPTWPKISELLDRKITTSRQANSTQASDTA